LNIEFAIHGNLIYDLKIMIQSNLNQQTIIINSAYNH